MLKPLTSNQPNAKKTDMKSFAKTLLAAAILLAPCCLFAYYDNSLKWRTLTSEHFRIYYHSGIEAQAQRLAVIAEEVHAELSPKLHWKPWGKTFVVLADITDSANGSSTPFPANTVVLYLTRPKISSVLSNYDEWLRILFIHEYTHTLNLDMINGFWSFTRYFPGRVWFPSIFQPIWILEGHAVYQESKETGKGRNNSTYADMIMRSEILSGRFKSYSKAAVFPREWPRGNVPYLYGGRFLEYLDATYGYGSAANIFVENSDNVIPYLINKNARDLFGKSFAELWEEWKAGLEAKYTAEAKEIEARGLTDYKRLSEENDVCSYPAFSPDGKSLFYIKSSPRTGTHLVKTEIASGKTKKLCRVFTPTGLTIGADGAAYLSDMASYRNYSFFNEAYIYNGSRRRLTKRLRGAGMDISPRGDNTVYVAENAGSYSLVINSPDFTQPNELIADASVQLSGPKFSPAGDAVAFTAKEQDGANIYVYSLTTGAVTKATSGACSDIEPAWTPSGELVFSSDRTGVYNLWELNLVNGELRQLTNLTGGAFMPAVSSDGGTIAFTSYEAEGCAAAIMPYPASGAKAAAVEPIAAPLPAKEVFAPTEMNDENQGQGAEKSAQIKSTGYNPLHSLLPRLVLPIFYTNEIYPNKYDVALGLYTFGWDALQRHQYSLSLTYIFPKEKRFVADVSYTYSGLYPQISLGYYDETLVAGKDKFPFGFTQAALYRSLSRLGYLTVSFPFISMDSVHRLNISAIYECQKLKRYYPSANRTFSRKTYVSRAQLLYYYSNARSYAYSVSKENGRDLLLVADIYNKEVFSDYTFYRLGGMYSEYLPGFFANNAAVINLRGAAFIHRPAYFKGFSLGQSVQGSPNTTSANMHKFWGLRGYAPDAEEGNYLAAAALEYRFPVLQKDLSFGLFPVMLRNIWITIFAECGNVWSIKHEASRVKTAAGIQLHADFLLGYNLGASAFVGYARGFNDNGEHRFYFGIGTQIDDILNNYNKRLAYF